MSLCDQCPDPGRCCRGFVIGAAPSDPALGAAGARAALEERAGVVLPFDPVSPVEPDSPLSPWRWSCPKLDACGRCSIYETRPVSPCRNYQPVDDGLCIFWHLQEEMDAAFAATIEAEIFADDAFEGGEWKPPAIEDAA